METWFLILLSLSVSILLRSIVYTFFTTKRSTHRLPPGPRTFPIIGDFLWLRKSPLDLEPILRSLHAKFGPIITIHMASIPAIFVADRALAHQALIQNGAVYADRPAASAVNKVVTSNRHNVNSASYGPTWRILRRNLTSEILHPSHLKSFSRARLWVLKILKSRIESQAKSGHPVIVRDNFQFSMFRILVLMCFGDALEESQMSKIEAAEKQMLLNISKFNILNFWPSVTKILLRRLWEEFLQMRKDQEDALIPLINARKKVMDERIINKQNKENKYECYVDTLLGLELPDGKRKLEEGEIVSLCSEFVSAGTDTTSTALQWIMANLVKYPHIQEQLFVEIKGIVGEEEEEVKEDDLEKMPYLKAVIIEGLRRHPPGHFVLPHTVTQDTVLDKFVVPKNAVINFMVAEMGRDPKVWEDPMAFRPERFVNGEGEAFDITGSREIKMMPFGVGRRICPGYGLAMLHLEYFVANLIWTFEWKAVDSVGVDLSEKDEFTVVMKNPLQAYVTPRSK